MVARLLGNHRAVFPTVNCQRKQARNHYCELEELVVDRRTNTAEQNIHKHDAAGHESTCSKADSCDHLKHLRDGIKADSCEEQRGHCQNTGIYETDAGAVT